MTAIGDLNQEHEKSDDVENVKVSLRTLLSAEDVHSLTAHIQMITLQANYHSIHYITLLFHLHTFKFTLYAISPCP